MTPQDQRINDRYVLIGVLGRGAMGEVWRATDLQLRRTVAVKLMMPSVPHATPQQLATWEKRFEREARLTARLRHPGVPAVHDYGRLADGRLFLVMELVVGETLTQLLIRDGPLPPARVADIAVRTADILAHAHSADVVHRDLKPSNLMLAPDGSVYVLDFGVATALGPGPDAATLTATNAVVGTPAFVSPEQALNEPATACSDLYALGCVLFTLLCGSPPFAAPVQAVLVYQHAYVEPPKITDRCPDVPPELADLIMGLLAKKPQDRPTGAEVAAVCRVLAAHGTADRTGIVPGPRPSSPVRDGSTRPMFPRAASPRTHRATERPSEPAPDPDAPLLAVLTQCREQLRAQHFNAAHQGYTALVASLSATRPDTDPFLLACRAGLAECQTALGRADEALAELRRLLPAQITALGATATEVLRTRFRIARVTATMGRVREARDALVALDAEQRAILPPDDEQVTAVPTLIERLNRLLEPR